jgi:hydrogenase expression/formation protein HypD
VCTIMGFEAYRGIAEKFKVPIVITGFEPVDILEGICKCTQMLEQDKFGVENQYSRSVKEQGNLVARKMIEEVFEQVDMVWRGIGLIPKSGLKLSPPYEGFDAEKRFGIKDDTKNQVTECKAGEVLQGLLKPSDCPYFGNRCHPESPMGAPMVSTEGACAAYFQYAAHKIH